MTFCVSMGLTVMISVAAKPEVVVFHGAGIEGSWSLPGLALPLSWSFKYLRLSLSQGLGSHVASAAFCRPGC